MRREEDELEAQVCEEDCFLVEALENIS